LSPKLTLVRTAAVLSGWEWSRHRGARRTRGRPAGPNSHLPINCFVNTAGAMAFVLVALRGLAVLWVAALLGGNSILQDGVLAAHESSMTLTTTAA